MDYFLAEYLNRFDLHIVETLNKEIVFIRKEIILSFSISDKCSKERLRASLHGGGGPQVGEVTRLAVVEKYNAFTCNLTTPGCWGEVSLGCCCACNYGVSA